MRNYFISFIVAVFFVLCFGVVSAEAATLNFSPTTATVAPNGTIDVQVNIDPGTDQITGTDAIVIYDPTLLEAQTVTYGTYFPVVSKNIASGKVSIYGTISDPSSYKTGTGTVATITFKALQAGTANLAYLCDTTASNTSKISKNDFNATNIINCSQNGTFAATISGSGGAAANTPTPTTTSSLTPTTAYATPTVAGGSATISPYPSALPETGFVDNTFRFVMPAILLLFIGVGLKFII